MLRLTVRCVMLFCWLVNSFDAPGGPNEWAGLARLSLYYYQKSIEGEKRGKKRAGPKTDREVKRFLMTWSCCCCCWRFFLLFRSAIFSLPPCARKAFSSYDHVMELELKTHHGKARTWDSSPAHNISSKQNTKKKKNIKSFGSCLASSHLNGKKREEE